MALKRGEQLPQLPLVQLGFSKNVLPTKQLRLKRTAFVPCISQRNVVRGADEIDRILALGRAGKIRGGRR